MPIESVPLASLVEDMAIYPRHSVDDAHVTTLVLALESGQTLPPIAADRKSRRVTDGWHRCRAYRRVIGDTAVVDVELVAYKNEAEMVLDAVARNSAHGRRLDAMDRTRSVIMLREVGFNDSQIGLAMHMPESRVEKISLKVAKAPKSSGQTVPGTSMITLKRSVAHMAGETLSKSQAQAHAMLPGTSFMLIAKQLHRGLAENMVNLEDARLVAMLKTLRDLLVQKLL